MSKPNNKLGLRYIKRSGISVHEKFVPFSSVQSRLEFMALFGFTVQFKQGTVRVFPDEIFGGESSEVVATIENVRNATRTLDSVLLESLSLAFSNPNLNFKTASTIVKPVAGALVKKPISTAKIEELLVEEERVPTHGSVVIYCDGASRGNPGVGGWGALLQSDLFDEDVELFGGDANATNNQMELMGAIAALECLTERMDVTVYTDSQYVTKGISSWIHGWKKNNWISSQKTPVKNKELWIRLDEAASKHAVTWQWVKGHSGVPGNENADRLANRGADAVARRGRVV